MNSRDRMGSSLHIGIALAIASACGSDGARGEGSSAGTDASSSSASAGSAGADGSPASSATTPGSGDDDGDATSLGTSGGASGGTSDDDGATLGGSGSSTQTTGGGDSSTAGDTGSSGCERPEPGVTLLGCELGAPDGRLVADDAFVYAPAGAAIHRVALDGSGAEVLVSVVGGARDLALGDGALFYAAFEAGAVARVDPADGTEAWLVDGLVSPSCIVVAGSFVYVSEHGEDAAIVRIPIDGGDPEPFFPMLDYPGTLATVATDLYYTTGNDSTFAAPVYRAPLAGPPGTLILSTTGLMTELVPFGDAIYFDRQSAVGTAITAMPIATPFAPMTLETTENLTLGLAVTSERVAWTETDAATWSLRSVTLAGDDLVDHVDDTAAFGDVLAVDDTLVFLGYDGVARLD